MLLGDGSKHKKSMNRIGIKNKTMHLNNNMKRKSFIKLKKQGVCRQNLNKG